VPVGVTVFKRPLVIETGVGRLAVQAAYLAEITVQIDHATTPGFAVEAIDVLRYQGIDLARRLQASQRVVCGVRASPEETLPPDITPRPVAFSKRNVLNKILKLNGLGMLPITVPIAVIGNTRTRTDARAAHDGDRFVAGEKTGQCAAA